jgi:hypothetical protein
VWRDGEIWGREGEREERAEWDREGKMERGERDSGLYWQVELPVSKQVFIVVLVGATPSQILTSPEVLGSKLMVSSDGWCSVREGKALKVHQVSSSFTKWSKFEVAWRQLVPPLFFFLFENSKFLLIFPGHACVLQNF